MNNLPPSLPPRASRLPWVLVGVLLVLNAALVGWLFMAPALAARPPQPARPTTGAAFLADTLQLTPAQRRQYDTLRARYLRQVRPLAQNCRQSCQQYFAQLDTTLTDAQLAAHSRAALASKVAVDVATVRHLQRVASICTPPQRQRLQQLLGQPPKEGCAAPGGDGEGCYLPLNRLP